MYWRDYTDLYRSGELTEIQFQYALIDKLIKWGSSASSDDWLKRNDRICYKQLKHSRYYGAQIKQLNVDINNTRNLFKLHVELNKDAFPFASTEITPLGREQDALVAFLNYQNKNFDLQLFSGLKQEITFEEGWLMENIFVLRPQSLDKALYMITVLECLRLDERFVRTVDEKENSRDYAWQVKYSDIFVEKVRTIVEDWDLPALYFYLSLTLRGIVTSKIDNYTYSKKKLQMWRLSSTSRFSFEFAECLSTHKLGAQEWLSTYICGRVLPARFPLVKLEEGLESGQSSTELLGFKYAQFIYLDDIKVFTDAENLEIVQDEPNQNQRALSYWEQKSLDEKKARKGVQKEKKVKTIKRHLYKTWEQVGAPNELPGAGALDIFLMSRMEEYLGFAQSSYGTLKEVSTVEAFTSKRLPTMRLLNQQMDKVKFITKDTQNFKLDKSTGLWTLPAIMIPEKIEVISSTSNHQDQFRNETLIIRKLTEEQNADKLLQILEQIPNLDLQLNALQKAVVVSTKDLLCLGRSGTGKTTSSVLRLFSQEIMFLSLRKVAAMKKNKEIQRTSHKVTLTSQDLKEPCAMKTVFLSASPVLVNEVSRFYKRLKDSLIDHLEKKERAQMFQSEDLQSQSDIEAVKAQHDELIKLAQIEADEIDQEIASNQQFEIPNAFEDLRPKHFPLFATVKQLLYMLDASLSNSFFCRDGKNNLIGMSSNLSWHNENKGMFMINSEYKNVADYDALLAKYGDELLQDQDLPVVEGAAGEKQQQNEDDLKVDRGWYYYQRYRTAEEKTSKSSCWLYSNQQLSFEVDFDIFVQKFYQRFKSKNQNLSKQNKLSETMIWTEIFSVIKGGLNSGDHYQGFLTARNYISKYASPFLSDMERKTVYWIFLEYEMWKKKANAFDLMDLVHHINSSGKLNQRYYNDMRINYLMIDEVQDLTPKTLQLLLKITNERVFFAGDTAQTIAKGVGARFSDLSTLLSTFGTKVIQLTTNYRSHGQILALANSVVGLIETLFPFSIDKLEKEESLTTGMKPLIIMPLPDHELRSIFLGKNNATKATTGLSSHKPQFGCNQVVIVRDQDQKDRVPDFLKAMLCLTVYEAKGLEFDDVILYNFFYQGEIEQMHWKLLNEVAIETKQGDDGVEFDQIVDGLESLLNDEQNEELKQFQEITKRQKKLKNRQVMINNSTKNRSLVYRKYAQLCIELKQLYVAITRPKKRLIIYDDEAKTRIPIQRVWESLGVVTVVSSTMIEQNQLPEEVCDLFLSEQGCLSSDVCTPQDWKVQGIKFYKKKQFDQAIKCFTYAGEQDLVVKCTAYKLADEGNIKISEADSIMWRIKNVSSLQKAERRAETKKAHSLRVAARKEFERAGQSFDIAGLKTQAASCFFTARNFVKAAQAFEQLHQYSQAGECLMLAYKDSSAILRAAEMFEKGNLTSRAIECYERIGAWERLLQCIHEKRGSFKKSERESLANKYIPIALNKLYLLLTGEEKVEEKNQGALAEIKIKAKYAKQVQELIVEEEEEQFSDSEVEDSSDSQDQQLEEVAVEERKEELIVEKEESKVLDLSGEVELIEDEEEAGLEVFEEVFQLKRKKSKQEEPEQIAKENENDLSYEIISDGDSGSQNSQKGNKLGASGQSDFEHLSQYDPDDEFLQSSHSYSLLQSILSNREIEQSSEYSIIEDEDSYSIISGSSYSGSVRMIKSQKKVEDAIVRKIIFYISLFSDEVKLKLDRLGKSSKANDSLSVENEEEIDLTKISPDFLETILNILEHYDLIKLCLIICNKFKLTSKLGRYAVSSCLKYQSLQQVRFTSQFEQIRSDTTEFQKLKQQSMIAHEAIHNVFGLIAPQYLTLKRYDEPLTENNSLGMDNYRLIFALGFWKKLVYTMNVSTSLQLCYKFADTYNFNIILDRLSDQTQLSETQNTWSKLIYLKQAAIVISKYVQKNKAKEFDLIRKFQTIVSQIKEELSFGQLLDKPLVQDLVDLVSYLIIPDLKNSRVEVVIGNKIQTTDAKIERQKIQTSYDQLYSSTLQKGQLVVQNLFGEERKDSETEMIKGVFAYQLAAYGTSHQKLNKLIKEVPILMRILDLFKSANQSLKLPKQFQLSKAALFMSYNISSLGSDDYNSCFKEDGNSNESLFKQFEETHYLVSVNSQIITQISRIQKLKLQTAQSKQYMLLGERICELEFKRQRRTQKIYQLIKSLERNGETFDIESFKSQAVTNRSHLALLIDMDLQFVLVPKEWIDSIILPQVSLVPAQLTEIIEKHMLHQIQEWSGSEPELKLKQTFIIECINNSYRSGIVQTQTDMHSFRKLNLSQFEDIYELEKIFSSLSHKNQTDLFTRTGKNINIRRNLEVQTKPDQLKKELLLSKDQKLQQLIILVEGGSLRLKKTAIMESETDYDIASRSVLRDAGLNFIEEAQKLIKQPLDKHLDSRNQIFFNFLKQSLHLYTLAGHQSVFIDLVNLMLRKQKMHSSFRSILKGFKSQAYCDSYLLQNRIVSAAQHQIIFYQKVAPFVSIDVNCDVIQESFFQLLVLLQANSVIPDYALKYLDSKADIQSMISKAEAEIKAFSAADEYDEEIVDHGVDEEEYYDEWDRPDVAEIKQIQLQKRPSRQPQKLHKVLEYKADLKLSVDRQKVIHLVLQLLKKMLELLKLINSDDFSKISIKQIFNMVMCVCVNSEVEPFVDVIRKCYNEFEKSALSDQFHELLFQYTDNPYDLKEMFADTEDFSKFQFFTDQIYLVNVEISGVTNEIDKVACNYDIELQLLKRVSAKRTIQKYLKARAGKTRAFLRKDWRQKLEKIGADIQILSVDQDLPYLPVLLTLIELVAQRLLDIQSYYTSNQTQVSCFDIQMILTRQNDYEEVRLRIINAIKTFIQTKCPILLECEDVGEADSELRLAAAEAQETIKRLDSQLQIWNMLSKQNKNLSQMEDEVQRAQRMRIKWQSWNTLTQRKLRLQQKLKRLEAK